MQNIVMYVAADQALGTVKDFAGAKPATAPVMVLGSKAMLRMRLFSDADGDTAYDIGLFAGIVSWQFVMDADYDASTTHKVVADNADISVATVTATVSDSERTYTEVAIPISNLNSTELQAALGTAKTYGLNSELCGYDSAGDLVFVLQVEGFTIRNRIVGVDDPTDPDPAYLNAEQVRALIASGVALQYSVDGSTDWHNTQASGDLYIRFRSASSETAAWSGAIALIQGAAGSDGADGVSSYTYVAYASDAAGAGFSLTPTSSLKYRAEIHTSAEISTPVASDFSGATWVKYIGDDGATPAVAWADISGKPSTFTPAAHTHIQTAILDAARQRVKSAAGLSTLYLDCPILINTSPNTSASLTIDFSAIKSYDGSAYSDYTGVSGDFFTWEYHVPTSVALTSIAVGGTLDMEIAQRYDDINGDWLDSVPSALPLKDSDATVHVFVIRAIYDSTATNNLRLQVSYAYSYGA
ncbi:MAG: hypothetical protein AB7F40_04290 [Victivallaceae bacterium]